MTETKKTTTPAKKLAPKQTAQAGKVAAPAMAAKAPVVKAEQVSTPEATKETSDLTNFRPALSPEAEHAPVTTTPAPLMTIEEVIAQDNAEPAPHKHGCGNCVGGGCASNKASAPAPTATDVALRNAALLDAIVQAEGNIGRLASYLNEDLMDELKKANATLEAAQAEYDGAAEANKVHFAPKLDDAKCAYVGVATKCQIVQLRIKKAMEVLDALDTAFIG